MPAHWAPKIELFAAMRSTLAACATRVERRRQDLSRAAAEARGTLIFAQFEAGDLVAVHLIGTVGEAQHASSRIGVSEPVIPCNSSAAKRLDCPVDDPASHVGRRHLDLADAPRRSSTGSQDNELIM